MPKHRKKPPNASAPFKSSRPGVIEAGDATAINWLLKYLYKTADNSRTNRSLFEALNERTKEFLSTKTKGTLQILLNERKEIERYLFSKCHVLESPEYKAEFECYDFSVEPLNEDFHTIIAGLHKLPASATEQQSLIDEIFYLWTFPLDHSKKREYNLLLDEAGYRLQCYHLSYKLRLQDEGKREGQEEEISSPERDARPG